MSKINTRLPKPLWLKLNSLYFEYLEFRNKRYYNSETIIQKRDVVKNDEQSMISLNYDSSNEDHMFI